MSLRSMVPFARREIEQKGKMLDHPLDIGSLGLGTSIKKIAVDAPGAEIGDVVTCCQCHTGEILPAKVGFLEPQCTSAGRIEVAVVAAGLSSALSLGTIDVDIRWYRPNK